MLLKRLPKIWLAPTGLILPKNYNVWIVTENNGTKNAGMLVYKNAKTASLKTFTAFDVKEIIITFEDQGDYSYPVGIEIARTSFK